MLGCVFQVDHERCVWGTWRPARNECTHPNRRLNLGDAKEPIFRLGACPPHCTAKPSALQATTMPVDSRVTAAIEGGKLDDALAICEEIELTVSGPTTCKQAPTTTPPHLCVVHHQPIRMDLALRCPFNSSSTSSRMTCKYFSPRISLPHCLDLLVHHPSISNEARFLWKRTPAGVKATHGELPAAWAVGQELWRR